ncbi:MAG: GTPase [Candidatus Aenigmarchaeota archaeon]|nr:GTPase [Candidatus Aenigmarchaeota archaeon]
MPSVKPRNVLILGAAGRDFHNFNVFYRGRKEYNVCAFTAAQIPDISGRKYPKELAGKLYPNGIPIYPEEKLPEIIRKFRADDVVFSYSDVSHEHVMHLASIAIANGANFALLGSDQTMLKSTKPVIAVCAVRTGSGKSQTTRWIANYLRDNGKRVVVVRHAMPYGDLRRQVVQRFETYWDLERQHCTIEEREEYEPHIALGIVVYAGVDYEKILRSAEKEGDVILWDGGNNDLPFFKPDLHIVVADPHRASHVMKYHPGEANVRMADLVIINKVDSAHRGEVDLLRKNIRIANKRAKILLARSPIDVEMPDIIKGKNVIVIEDGPTITHGGMQFGAGTIAARKYKCRIIDAERYAIGSLRETYKKYPHLQKILPAMGYGKRQTEELEKTIDKAKCDAVIIGTPVDLRKIIRISKPTTRIFYSLQPLKPKDLEKELARFI